MSTIVDEGALVTVEVYCHNELMIGGKVRPFGYAARGEVLGLIFSFFILPSL